MTWGGGAVGSLRVQNRAVWVCVISHRYICWIAGSSEWKLTLCVCVGVCVHACVVFFFKFYPFYLFAFLAHLS